MRAIMAFIRMKWHILVSKGIHREFSLVWRYHIIVMSFPTEPRYIGCTCGRCFYRAKLTLCERRLLEGTLMLYSNDIEKESGKCR